MKTPKSTDELTVAQIGRLGEVSRQAIINAITRGRLNATRKGKRWRILWKDFVEYRDTMYSRKFLKYEGEPVFDIAVGHFSISQVAKIFSVSLGREYKTQRLRYMIRKGRLRAFRKGAAWVISGEDAAKFLQVEAAASQEEIG